MNFGASTAFEWTPGSRQDVAGLDGILLGSPRNGPIELKLKEIPV